MNRRRLPFGFERCLPLLALAVFPTSCAHSPALVPVGAEGIVRLNTGATAAEVGGEAPLWALRLEPMPWFGKIPRVRLVALRRIPDDNGERIDGEVWEVLFTTRGAWTGAPRYATCTEWQLDDARQGRAFAASRRELFELFRDHVPDCAQFTLLRRAGDSTRFLELGLHGTLDSLNAALTAAHEPPDLQKFDATNPPARWTAHNVYGPRGYIPIVP